jgi:hypothetical protein
LRDGENAVSDVVPVNDCDTVNVSVPTVRCPVIVCESLNVIDFEKDPVRLRTCGDRDSDIVRGVREADTERVLK